MNLNVLDTPNPYGLILFKRRYRVDRFLVTSTSILVQVEADQVVQASWYVCVRIRG